MDSKEIRDLTARLITALGYEGSSDEFIRDFKAWLDDRFDNDGMLK